jgi:hypothetical protein
MTKRLRGSGKSTGKLKRIWKDEELIATEETGTKTRRKIGAIATRTDETVQPALRPMRKGRMRLKGSRIGTIPHHR